MDMEDALRYVGVGLVFDGRYIKRSRSSDPKAQRYIHREIANAGPDDYVDHINRNKLDNRRHNLRVCTQQMMDARRHAKERVRLVTEAILGDAQRWRVTTAHGTVWVTSATYTREDATLRFTDHGASIEPTGMYGPQEL